MKNFLSYEEYAILEFMENEYALLEYEEKDLKRVWDIIGKAKGKDDKVSALIARMAKSITDREKAFRRGEAVMHIMGENPADKEKAAEFAKIFFDRAKELGLDVDRMLASEETKPTWDSKKYVGIMYLPSWSAATVWEHEILGQLSDGAWENSGPHDHWEFWHKLDLAIGRPKVAYNYYGRIKNGYNLAGLIQYVGDRMVNMGRMGMALNRRLSSYEASAAEDMPPTFEQFMADRQEAKTYSQKELQHILPGDAQKFYRTKYDEKDLRNDLQVIKTAMKTAG